MYRPQEDVSTFMRACDQDVRKTPTVPDDGTLRLRCRLIMEEALEFVEAAGFDLFVEDGYVEGTVIKVDRKHMMIRLGTNEPSVPEMAKELADINYVTYGAAATIGVDLPEVFQEVQRSNMTKVGLDGKVLKNEHGKVLKPDTYQPAQVEKVLAKQGWS